MRWSYKYRVFAVVVLATAAGVAAAQAQAPENKHKSQEISASDGTPVLLMHLPEYEKVAGQATFASDAATLKKVLGERPELDLIDFAGGTEAVTAPYEAGKLVIVEYSSPQASEDADARFQQTVAGNAAIVCRRIGNYNVLVFDVADKAAASALLDQVRYEKDIQWLGAKPERPGRGVSVPQMANVLLSSIFWLVGGGVLAIAGGALLGYLYYRRMLRHRAEMATFSDAGGITRLNLDGLTPDVTAEKLLHD